MCWAAPEHPSILFAYAFGKAQRLLAELAAIGVTNEVLLLGPVKALMQAYREAGVRLPSTLPVRAIAKEESLAGRLVIAALSPPLAVDEELQSTANGLRERRPPPTRRL